MRSNCTLSQKLGWPQTRQRFATAIFAANALFRALNKRRLRDQSATIISNSCFVLFLGVSLSCRSVMANMPLVPKPDWRITPVHRSTEEINRIGQALVSETLRVLTGQTSDRKTKEDVWRARYESDSGPPPIPPFAIRLVRESFDRVPREVLQTTLWQDRYETFASPDYGIVFNRKRVGELVWTVDSASLGLGDRRFRQFLIRPPGDYALLLLISHELAHLAIAYATPAVRVPESVAECAADIIGGFQSAVLATRISSDGGMELAYNGAVDAFSGTLVPGNWISRELHPDNEQRAACVNRGVAMFSEQRHHQPIAGIVMLQSARDSLIDALSLGRMSLVSVAVADAKNILSIPGDGKTQPSSSVEDAEDAAAKPLLALNDSLLQRLSSKTLSSVVGQAVAVGVSLFPGKQFNELSLPVGYPWKCAVIAGNTDIGRAFACYAVTSGISATLIRLRISTSIQGDSVRRGYRVLSVGPTTTSSSQLRMRQWLFANGTETALVSVYDEPFRQSTDQVSGLRVFWFSFSDLRVVPSGRRR